MRNHAANQGDAGSVLPNNNTITTAYDNTDDDGGGGNSDAHNKIYLCGTQRQMQLVSHAPVPASRK